jgi:hypothetical protein
MSAFENLLETAPSTPEPEASRPSLEDLLKDPVPETDGQGDAGETQQKAEPQEGVTPKTLKDWAEKLGMEAKDLYSIEVPMADGKGVTLGELKDTFAKQDDLTRRELEFVERKVQQEAEWTRAQTELKALIQALPPRALSEQALQLVRQKAEMELKAEREATLHAIPEWADETRREAELQGMVELLKDYGFPPSYLQQAFSHKLIRFVRDAYLRKQRVEQALARVQKVDRPSTTGKSSPAGTAKKPSTSKPDLRSKGPEANLLALLQN